MSMNFSDFYMKPPKKRFLTRNLDFFKQNHKISCLKFAKENLTALPLKGGISPRKYIIFVIKSLKIAN